LLRLQAATLSHVRFESAAIAFCSELAEILDASRVALGMIRNRHSELVAVSRGGPEQLDRATTKAILAAMDEAYDQASTVVAPADERDRRISRATESLRRAHHGIVLVVPMAVDQAIVGAVTVELSDPKRPVAPVAALVEDAAALFGPALNVLQLNERPLWRRLRDDARTSAALWAAPARRPWRWAIGSLAAAMALLAFVPMGVSVSAPARVEGAVQRVVAAPAAGFLKSAAVRPGDAVKAGQTVAELLDRDLLLDRNKLLSEIAQHENAYAASMARADRANMMIYQAKLAEARAQADLVEQQLARIRMTAPIDGVVIQGDLSQSIGSPVEKGQTLMTIAPRDAFRVIVELDERDALMVRAGQTGNLSLSALPWDSTPVRLERVTPMATVIDGRNVFEIEATPLGDPKGLRAGLRGIARVDVDRAPPLRVWLRRLSDHTLRFLWRWLP
jgi:biotin carboxyl carrier protein